MAKSTMDRFFVHMKKSMGEVLENDPEVDQSRFSESFSKTEFLDFIMQHMILFLAEGKKDCGILTEMIRRSV